MSHECGALLDADVRIVPRLAGALVQVRRRIHVVILDMPAQSNMGNQTCAIKAQLSMRDRAPMWHVPRLALRLVTTHQQNMEKSIPK